MKLSLLTLISKDVDTSFPAQTVGSGALTPKKGMVIWGSGLTPAPNHFYFFSSALRPRVLSPKNRPITISFFIIYYSVFLSSSSAAWSEIILSASRVNSGAASQALSIWGWFIILWTISWGTVGMDITLLLGVAHPITRLSALKSAINLILGIFPIILYLVLAPALFFSNPFLLCQGFFIQKTKERFKDS